ncbi:MAG TPA: hypothetical protein VK205_00480 [Prolixibacteraceae bacterium]|nr:hypothetical protein [Prolixibacteraceae bacterium]
MTRRIDHGTLYTGFRSACPTFLAISNIVDNRKNGSIRIVVERMARGKEHGAGRPEASGQCSVANPSVHPSFSFCKLNV